MLRVLRGGGALSDPGWRRAGYRCSSPQRIPSLDIGLRPAR